MSKIVKYVIKNLGNISCQEIEPADICILTGKNSAGKSSVIKALRSALAGGNRQEMIKQGESEGSVSIVFDTGVKITRLFRAGKPATTSVIVGDMVVKNPQTIIDGLRDSFAIDIVKWTSKSSKDQTDSILQSIVLEIDDKEIDQALNGLDNTIGANALHIASFTRKDKGELPYIDALRKQLFDARTGSNLAAKDLQGLLNTAQESTDIEPPPQDDTSWKDTLNRIAMQKEKVIAESTTKREEMNASLRERERAEVAGIDYEIDILKDKKIVSMKQFADERIRKELELNSEEKQKLDEFTEGELIATSNADLETRAEGTAEQLETSRKQVEAHKITSDSLTEAMDNIDDYKSRLLTSVDIDGVSFKDGSIYIDEIIISEVNTARLLEISLQLANARLTDDSLRAIFVDNMECLDRETLGKFINDALAMDIQIFGAIVGDGPLEILAEENFEQPNLGGFDGERHNNR